MDKILFTGATGALGSEILPRLLAQGYFVYCLVRGENRKAAAQRIQHIVGDLSNARAIRGDITEPRCGISDIDAESLRGHVDRIFHCAASISFTDRAATYAANVNGVHHVLELAEVLGVKDIVHVSTTYVAGDVANFSERDELSSMMHRPRNYYEESKQVGETMMRAWTLNHEHRKVTIFRPSILVGRVDGTTPTFDAYYGFFLPIHRAAEFVRTSHARGKELPSGVCVRDNGIIEMPIVIQASNTSTLNLVPVDWVADMMVAVFASHARGETFHFVNPEPPAVRWVIDASLHHLRIAGARVTENTLERLMLVAAQAPLFRRAIQRPIDAVLNQYAPYTNHGTRFAMENTPRILGAVYRNPPAIDEPYIERLLEYALRSNWGGRLKPTV